MALIKDTAMLEHHLSACADVDARIAKGRTLLHLACVNAEAAAVDCLLTHGANAAIFDDEGGMPWLYVIRSQSLECAQALIRHEACLEHYLGATQGPPLLAACQHGALDIAQALITAGVDLELPNLDEMRPLHVLCDASHGPREPERRYTLMRALCEAGADPDAAGSRFPVRPLGLAAKRNDSGAVRVLTEAGASLGAVNTKGDTALYAAAHSLAPHALSALIDAGADPNQRTIDGDLPIVEAAKRGRPGDCTLLLSAGADPTLNDGSGENAYTAAQKCGHSETFEALDAWQRARTANAAAEATAPCAAPGL